MRLVLGFVLAAFPAVGYSLGLGALKVKSALHEPLNAEIDFTSISERELKGLDIGLATRAEFAAIGAERVPIVSQIKFIVAKRLDGRYFVQLHTDRPFSEPFLHLLVKVSWVGGQLVREYTALIDPPYLIAGRSGSIDVPTTEQSLAPAPAPALPESLPETMPLGEAGTVEPLEPAIGAASSVATQTASGGPADELLGPAPDAMPDVEISPITGWPVTPAGRRQTASTTRVIEPMTSSSTPQWSDVSEYHVKKGDTLWGIAQRVRADRQLSMEQVMLAIFQQNKDAFFANNVNNLKAGKILKMPERERVTARSKSVARKEFRAQYDVWQEYKLKLAGTKRPIKVAQAVPTPEPVKPAPKVEKAVRKPIVPPATKKQSQPAPAPKAKQSLKPEGKDGAQSDELLRIVRANLDDDKAAAGKNSSKSESSKKVGKTERQALEERVTTLEESIESKDLETKELSGKLGQVREHLKNEARLIEIDNEKLAKAQQAPAAETAAPTPPVEATKPAPAPTVEQAKSQTPAPAPVAKAKKPPAPKSAPRPAARPAPKKVVAPPPPAETDLLATVMDVVGGDDAFVPLVGGAAALIGGGILLIYLRRRRRSIAEFEESILASDAISADTGTTVDTAGQAAATGDTSFLSDFSQGGMGNIHTDEVDPIAEADVYLAYGRDETAEEILRDAIVKHPQRQELKQKLLEIYHQRNDVAAFETLAEELYAAMGGGGGPMWSKIEEMGRKLNPDNPMFRGGGVPAAAATGMLPAMGELDQAPPAGVDAETSPVSVKQVADEPAGDFDFDIEGASAPRAQGQSDGIDFDLELGGDAPAASATDTETEQTAEENQDASLDFSPVAAEVRASGMESVALDKPDSEGDGQSAEMENVIDYNFGDEKAKSTESTELALGLDAGADDGDLEIKWDVDVAAPDVGVETVSETETDTAVAEDTQQQWDETATKLDLAKAYIDMGDAEGARSILDEVLAEGTDDQKKQAAELSAQLA